MKLCGRGDKTASDTRRYKELLMESRGKAAFWLTLLWKMQLIHLNEANPTAQWWGQHRGLWQNNAWSSGQTWPNQLQRNDVQQGAALNNHIHASAHYWWNAWCQCFILLFHLIVANKNVIVVAVKNCNLCLCSDLMSLLTLICCFRWTVWIKYDFTVLPEATARAPYCFQSQPPLSLVFPSKE